MSEYLASYDENYDDHYNDIAIIGVAGRFPKASNVEQLWKNLLDSVEGVTFFSDEEILASGVSEEELRDPNYVKANILLENIEYFDAKFFDFTPREAEVMDPQMRFGLECAWEALEDAGCNPDDSKGSIGVFGGSNTSVYFLYNVFPQFKKGSFVNSLQAQVGFDKDFFATHIAYKFNLTGPCINVNTACSTSLVAVHVAAQSLLNGECRIALAGGSHVIKPMKYGYKYYSGGYDSADGHCRPFDADAQGAMGGTGVGFVVLKRLEDALADKDNIYAVIKGSAVNNDGSAKIGFTAPSVEGQMKVIVEAISMANVNVETVKYIETHGTGTKLGDPIEVAALSKAFKNFTDKKQFCAIGSIKSNIGHLGCAAGVVSLIKAALVVKTGIIPESLNFTRPNPNIDFDNSPFFVNNKLTKIERSKEPLRAGISSLGIGGTNAHVIIEEPPLVTSSESSRDYQLLMLSAKGEVALDDMTTNLKEYLNKQRDNCLADVSFTLQKGRKEFDHRRFVLVPAHDIDKAVDLIDPVTSFSSKVTPDDRKIVFLFSGGGTQYVNMGKNLFESEKLFREKITVCAEIIKRKVGFDLVSLVYPEKQDEAAKAELIKQPRYALPALFSIEYALAELWMSWGVKPDALMGHSLGEYTAAHLAGVISLEDVLGLVCLRGELFHKIGEGGMLTVALSEKKLKLYLNDDLDIAAINGPSRTVAAGTIEAINKLEKNLQDAAIDCRKLKIDTAGHSRMVESIIPEFVSYFEKVTLKAPQIPYISNVTGTWISDGEATNPEYWARHLRMTVRFAEGIKELFKTSNTTLLEVGPGNALSSFARLQVDIFKNHAVVNTMRHPREEKNDLEYMLETLGRLWLKGIKINWNEFYKEEERKKVTLPTYPFEHKKFWIEVDATENVSDELADKIKLNMNEWFYTPTWIKSTAPVLYKAEIITNNTNDQKNVIVFLDTIAVGDSLVALLNELNYRVVTVARGTEFEKRTNQSYYIDIQNKEHYDKLFASFMHDNILPDKIVHLFNMAGNDENNQDNYYFAHESFINLAKAIHNNNITSLVEIYAIINQLENVTGDEPVAVNKALITGPSKVIPYEFFNVSFKIIDIIVEDENRARLCNELLKEIVIQSADYTIALRGKNRWVKDFIKLELAPSQKEKLPLKEQGVYLVTGGLGGMGLTIAEYLSELKAHLVLVTRSDFPQREKWEKLERSSKEKQELRETLRKLLQFEKNGANVDIVKGDLTDRGDVVRIIDYVKKEYNEINGVFHCAGLNDAALIVETSPELTKKVFGPKVLGTRYLYDAIRKDTVDFFIICSSLSAVTSAMGGADYVSANAFQDYFANTFNSDKMLVASINWDIWEDVGMIKRNNLEEFIKTTGGDAYIYPDQGLETFLRVLQTNLGQVIVSTRNFSILKEKNKIINNLAIIAEQEDEKEAKKEYVYDRPNLSSTYVEPQTREEKILVEVWQQVLRVSRIGVHDNFFELGGESLMGIQVIAKAKQAGLIIQPKQMYAQPTIHAIAKAVVNNKQVYSLQGLVLGEFPLTPIEHAFLDLGLENLHHWNMPLLFAVNEDINPELLRNTAIKLIEHHDSFRLRYNKTGFDLEDQHWQKENVGVELKDLAEIIDLSDVAEEEYAAKMLEKCNELQKTLNISSGPIVRLVFIHGPKLEMNRLLLIMHHLVSDGFSLRFIVEDLMNIFVSLKNDLAINLPPKTTSFKKYALKLNEIADTPEIIADFTYWKSILSQEFKTITPDIANGENLVKHEDSVLVELSKEATSTLLHVIPSKLNITIKEMLVISFAQALAAILKNQRLLLSIVGHGRDELMDDVDVSRTSAWFGDGHPVVITLGNSNILDDVIAVKEQLHAVPHHGLSYGILKYLCSDEAIREELRSLPFPEINFNYLGQFDAIAMEDAPMKIAPEVITAPADGDGIRRFAHDVVLAVTNGVLIINWKYSGSQFEKDTIATIVKQVVKNIEDLMQLAVQTNKKIYTTTDFPLAGLSKEELHAIIEKYGNIDNIYPLTPMQQVMLDRSSRPGRHRPYLTQMVIDMRGEDNVISFRKSWSEVVKKHANFRTVFLTKGLQQPLQVVTPAVELPVIELDWSAEDAAGHDEKFAALLREDRAYGFNVEAAPLLRLHIVKLNAEPVYRLVLTNHQAVMDGWSSGIVTMDMMDCFIALKSGKECPAFKARTEFSAYIEWLQKQDRHKAEKYWKQELHTYTSPNYFQTLENDNQAGSEGGYAVIIQNLGLDFSTKLNEYTRANQVTLNTLVQGCWMLYLASLSGAKDIVCGVTVSGRPTDLENAVEIVGQCSNTLPLRSIIDDEDMVSWLKSIQEKNVSMREFEYVSIDDIRQFTGMSSDDSLYESNIIFENIPMAESGEIETGLLDSYWIDAWHFPLRLFVFPEKEITIRLAYDNVRFAESKIKTIMTSLHGIFETIIKGRTKKVSDILDNL